ncbi:hypothetical protein [Micrococcus sp. TA1]|uniref:hypothetical protein n=1 Tax=Micrococcus sp. TA1 TaxID=681627 RepID=UPI00161ED065|nr:hypothetical protein [Micrococcus sp. TA1]MBB5749559.1 hypothetical protein [Micrococcus sp. TA1]
MAFVQLIEYTTTRPEEVAEVLAEWERATQGKRTARRAVWMTYRDNPDRYCEVVFFDSYESAMENSQLPETAEFAGRMRELVDGEITFRDFDVVDEREL